MLASGRLYDDEEESGVFEPSGLHLLEHAEPTHVIAGRYEIVERIGEGGMGQVVRVRHHRLGKPFAVKLMLAEFFFEPEAREIFIREARLASTLSHPNIVSIVDFGEDPDWGMFIVMELAVGESLSQRIDNDGALSIDVACNVTQQLVDALAHSHAHSVVHGDLKSENVVCLDPTADDQRRWNIKLLDFGMAHVATGATGRLTRIAGTPAYMAPERIAGAPPAPSVDLYALGIILYEMLAGGVPFNDDDPHQTLQRQLHETPAPISERRGAQLDAALISIVDRCLAKRPEDRYPDADALGSDLSSYMKHRGLRRRSHGRRLTTAPGLTRDDAAATAFEALGVPAAGLSAEGTIVVANHRFARLLGHQNHLVLEGTSILDTNLGRLHPELREDLRLVAMDGKMIRRRLEVQGKGEQPTSMRLIMTPAAGAAGACVLVVHALPSAGQS